MANLTTAGILEALTVIGRDLKELSSPGYWRNYQNENARRHWKPLFATRKAYATIRDNGDAAQILNELMKVLPKAQQVQCELILRAMRGNLEGTYYTVKDGRLVTIYETK